MGEAFEDAGGVVSVHSQERALREVELILLPVGAYCLQGGISNVVDGIGDEHGLHAGSEDVKVVAAVSGEQGARRRNPQGRDQEADGMKLVCRCRQNIQQTHMLQFVDAPD